MTPQEPAHLPIFSIPLSSYCLELPGPDVTMKSCFLPVSYLILTTSKFCGTTFSYNYFRSHWLDSNSRNLNADAGLSNLNILLGLLKLVNTYFLFLMNPTRARLSSISITLIGPLGRYGDGIMQLLWSALPIAGDGLSLTTDKLTQDPTQRQLLHHYRLASDGWKWCFVMNMILATFLYSFSISWW